MNELQRELQEAAAELRRSVQDSVDPDAALASITAAPARRRRRVLAVAAAIAVLALGTTAVIRSTDDDLRVIGEPPATAPAAPATTTVPPDPSTSLPPAATAPPATWVAEDDAGRLVVVDTASGQVLRSLGQFDAPEAFEASGEPVAAGEFLGQVEVSPDGETVYYETCCEPAPGITYRIPSTGGEAEQVSYGAFPALSPDGSQLALVEMQWLTVTTLATGEVTRYEASEPPTALWELTWSPDGRYLAWEQPGSEMSDMDIRVLDLSSATSLDDARVVATSSSDGSPMLPTSDREGRLNIVRQHPATPGDDLSGPATAEVRDLRTGSLISTRELRGPVLDQSYDATGTYLIRTFADGSVRSWSPDGEPTELGAGFRSAVW